MNQKGFQDYLLPFGHICYGCGKDNEHGMQIRSNWEGESDVAVCHWTPKPHHCGGVDFMNGGVIATIFDCHTVATATAWLYRLENRPLDSDPPIHLVTASLHVDYLLPTPLDRPLILRANVTGVGERRVTVSASLISGDRETAKAEGVFARVTAPSAKARAR